MKFLIGTLLVFVSLQGFSGVGGNVGGSGGQTHERNDRIIWGKRLVTLADYDSSLSHMVSWPNVQFNNNLIPVKNVCADGVILRTINPIKVCIKKAPAEVCIKNTKGNQEECRRLRSGDTLPKENSSTKINYECVEFENQNFETSKFYEIPVCSKWALDPFDTGRNSSRTCSEYTKETKEYADKYKVSVTTTNNSTHSERVEVAVFDFEVPPCIKNN
jgi:hypothetical protein